MTIVYNNGNGGYVCDSCGVLLYSGGMEFNRYGRDDRLFKYGVRKGDVATIRSSIGDMQFCGTACAVKAENEGELE